MSDDDSPLPSPSELAEYLNKKIAKSRTSTSSSKTPTKVLLSPRIPLSNTPVKHDPDIPVLNTSSELSKLENICKGEEYIQIAHLRPQFSEFTHIFPAFPKTHVNGYAYIIELSDEILNEKAITDLRDALQYSPSAGGGAKVNENVKFFASEGTKVPMKIHYRQCAGISLSC